VKRLFRERYPKGVIISVDHGEEKDEEEDRSSKLSTLLAVVDFMLLGDANIIVHSRGSSFAREAAFRTNIPVLDVMQRKKVPAQNLSQQQEHIAFYSLKRDLDLCSMPEYIRETTAISPTDDLLMIRNVDDFSTTLYPVAEVSSVQPLSNNDSSYRICYAEPGRTMCSKLYWVCPCTSSQLLDGSVVELIWRAKLYCYDSAYSPHSENVSGVGVSTAALAGGSRCASVIAESNGYSI
jgi:hypothetical protein